MKARTYARTAVGGAVGPVLSHDDRRARCLVHGPPRLGPHNADVLRAQQHAAPLHQLLLRRIQPGTPVVVICHDTQR